MSDRSSTKGAWDILEVLLVTETVETDIATIESVPNVVEILI